MQNKYPPQEPEAPGCAIFVAIRAFALARSRLLIMKHFLDCGWRVIAIGNRDKHADELCNAGVEFEEIRFARGGLSPAKDLRAFRKLKQTFRSNQPDLIHNFQAKPIIFGCAAARRIPEARVVNTVTGLGHAFVAGGMSRRLASTGYRMFLGRASATIFQNPDDRDLFLTERLVRPQDAELIVSSGVDLERFCPAQPSACDQSPRVVMLTRFLWEKGVREFVEAARICKKRFPRARFQIGGELYPGHPDAIPEQWISEVVESGVVECLGYVERVEELLQATAVLVHPSYYPEGVPRILLEAAACAVPTVTTDTPGCREALEHQVTGLLVPSRDSAALADAIDLLLSDSKNRNLMGLEGRKLAERQFDQKTIVEKHLELYRQIGIRI